MESGTVVSWLKREGEPVEKDEPLAEIESEKVVNELPAPATGVLHRIEVAADEEAAVGSLLAIIAEPGDNDESVQRVADDHAPSEEGRADPPARAGRVASTPAARRLARDRGVEWRELAGTGPGGRIVLADVQGALRSPLRTTGEVSALTPLRRAIAERTLRSIQAPQAALCREIDLTDLVAARDAADLPFTACLVKLVALALDDVPQLSAHFVHDAVHTPTEIGIGVVVPAPEGIAVPVIHGAEKITVTEIADELRALSDRAATSTLRREDIEGSTFTLSNAGPLGIDIFQPLLNPPEVAALGVGTLRRRPWVLGDTIVARTTAHFCVATDHRVIDAAPVGKFLDCMESLLADPGPHLT